MPTLAEALLEGQQKVTSEPANVNHSANIGAGIQLAQHVQDVQLQREQLQQKQAEQEQQKFAKVGEWFDTAAKMPDGPAKRAFTQNFIPKGISALGLSEQFDPTVQKMLMGDTNLASYLSNEIGEGRLDYSALQDPDKIAGLAAAAKQFGDEQTFKDTVTNYAGDLAKSAKDRRENNAKLQRAEVVQTGQNTRADEARTEAGNVEVRKKVGDAFAAYKAVGGKSGVEKTLKKLERAREMLRSGKVILGTFAKNVPFGSSANVLARLDPAAKALFDDVQDSVNLRAALADGNPTKEQVEQVMSRTLDGHLDNEMNIRKLDDAIEETRSKVKNAEDSFREFKFLKDEPKQSAFAPSDQQKEVFAKIPKDAQMKTLQDLAKKLNIPLSSVRKAFGMKE